VPVRSLDVGVRVSLTDRASARPRGSAGLVVL